MAASIYSPNPVLNPSVGTFPLIHREQEPERANASQYKDCEMRDSVVEGSARSTDKEALPLDTRVTQLAVLKLATESSGTQKKFAGHPTLFEERVYSGADPSSQVSRKPATSMSAKPHNIVSHNVLKERIETSASQAQPELNQDTPQTPSPFSHRASPPILLPVSGTNCPTPQQYPVVSVPVAADPATFLAHIKATIAHDIERQIDAKYGGRVAALSAENAELRAQIAALRNDVAAERDRRDEKDRVQEESHATLWHRQTTHHTIVTQALEEMHAIRKGGVWLYSGNALITRKPFFPRYRVFTWKNSLGIDSSRGV
ncbi:hypothetical protein HDU93_004175 [Gonapodya sp. JEL0774]|nr:hypothetical protein HDU93_004175 [Gonapodya sp. JEL0774]